MMPSSMTVYRTCNVCEAMCGLAINLSPDGQRILEIRADKDDVFSSGHICPKGPAMRELYEDPDRLRRPVRRQGGGFVEISFEEAFAEAAERLREIRKNHGKDAVGVYVGNPTVHNHGLAMMVPSFEKALGTKNRFDANSQDANPRLLASMLLYGDQLSIPVPDVDRTDLLVILGANPYASNGSLMTLGDVRGRLKGIRDRGGQIVLIDPRRTETAEHCDEHLAIHPGGDAPLLLALLQVLFAEGLVRWKEASAIATGLPDLEAACSHFSPERVGAAIALSPETIRVLARKIAAAKNAVVYGRVGTCHNPFGTTANWLIDAVNIVTGNFDKPGGAMFATPAVDLALLGRKLIGSHYARWTSRVRKLPELSGQLPASVIAEEIETPGPGQIKALVTIAGNPVLSVPNGERLAKALSQLSFQLSIDHYINETTQHAHLIIPPVAALSRSHYDVVFHGVAVRNTVKYSEPVLPRDPGGYEDWEILYELSMRLGGIRLMGKPVDRVLGVLHKMGWRASIDRVLDLLLRMGPYGDRFNPFSKGLNLDKVRKAPHGIDLGPLVPCRKQKIRTIDGLVNLAPKLLLQDLARVEQWLDRPRPSLVLIGRRHLRTNNSWMHNLHSLVKGPDRSHLLMNPTDVLTRGIAPLEEVEVHSRTGMVRVTVQPSDEVPQGVVCLPHGYGHRSAASTLRIAGALKGENLNALTDDAEVDPLSGTAVLSGVPVEIHKVSGSRSKV